MVAGKKSCGRCWAGHRLDFNWRCSDQAIRVFSVPTTSIFNANAKHFQFSFNTFSMLRHQYLSISNTTDIGSQRYSVGTAYLSAAGQQGLTGNHWFTPNFSCTLPSLSWQSSFIDTRHLLHYCMHKEERVSVGKLPKSNEQQSKDYCLPFQFSQFS